MPIDVLATAPHYADHVSAVFGALPTSHRGDFLTPMGGPAADSARAHGFDPVTKAESANPVLVASHGDLDRAHRLGRRVAIMEHGAGQSYGGRRTIQHGAYAGGRSRDAASLFLHPGPHPAARDRAAYPDARVEVVGSPILDTLPKREATPGRVVALSFHFNMTITPETRSAQSWIWPAVLDIRERFEILGHAHPRVFAEMTNPRRGAYTKAGIEAVASFDDVCRRADVYVCDNSSTIFAFAATGRPVVVLNPPWYDRDVDHGLRFWDAADVGVNCDDPADLADCIEEALADTPTQKARRERALDLVYAYRTGASQRAADVLMDWAA